MDLPPIRDVEVPLKYEGLVTLEKFLYDSGNIPRDDIAKFILDSKILESKFVQSALIQLDYDLAIDISKEFSQIKPELIEKSYLKPAKLYKLYKGNVSTLDQIMQLIKNEQDITFIQEFLQYFRNEIQDPTILLKRLTPQLQMELQPLITKISPNENAKDTITDKLNSIFTKDDLDAFKTLFESLDKDILIDNPRNSEENKFEKLNLLDFAAYKGAERCFTLLLDNEFEITQRTLANSIFGKNVEVLRKCMEEKDFPRRVLVYAVESRNYDAFDIIINDLKEDEDSNYDSEVLDAFHESLGYGTVMFYLYLKNLEIEKKESLFYLKNSIFVEDLASEKPSMINSLQQTPLFVVNDVDTLKELIKLGIDVNHHDKLGRTALFIAAMKNDFEKVKFLASKGSLVSKEFSIIHNCLSCKLFKMARLLLNIGCPIDEQSSKRLHQYETNHSLDDDFSDEDDMYVMMETHTGIFHQNMQDDVSSDGYSDFDM